MTLKAAAIFAVVVGTLAVGIHLFAPHVMHHLGHMLHGGR
jgi:hypothetical protein